MELTDAMVEEIRQACLMADYGKVVIEIEMKGNEPSADIITTTRRRFQKSAYVQTDKACHTRAK